MMKLRKRWTLSLFGGAAIVAACGTNEGEKNENNVPEQEARLVETMPLPEGSECEAGGSMIRTGVDENGNGSLDDDEVTSSMNVCDGVSSVGTNGKSGVKGMKGATGADGLDLLSSVTDAGAACKEGGIVVSFGLDDDRNGDLSSGEISDSSTVCAGSSPEEACPPVMRVTPVDPGALCLEGGVIIAHGQDSGLLGAGGAGGAGAAVACDGILSASEQAGAELLCNGMTGEQGEPGDQGDKGDQGDPGDKGDTGDKGDPGSVGDSGLNSLTVVTVVPDGAECSGGGFLIKTGMDDDADAVLDDPSEVDATTYLCTSDVDGDGVGKTLDNCPVDSNPTQIDQDGDLIGDVCDDDPCPGSVCLASCSELLDAGEIADGQYAIDPSGSNPILAQCDMTTDGGGWTLVLNYAHAAGTNPALEVRTTDLPLLGDDTTLGDDESGTEYWGHTGSSMFASLDATELRFVGATSHVSRVLDFTTTACIDYFETGTGSCSGIGTANTELTDHTGNLPDASDSYYTNQGDLAMTEFPFYNAGDYHWGVRGLGSRWESDESAGASPYGYDTWHQVWARTGEDFPASCLDILEDDPSATSGVYSVDFDPTGADTQRSVYCDMVTDGGGWTLILSSTLSGSGPNGYFTGTGSGTPSTSTDFKAAITSTDLVAIGVDQLRVDVEGEGLSRTSSGITNLAAFGTDNTGCNVSGVSLGNGDYWHPGRQWNCYGSAHFGVSTGATGNVHIDYGEHYGHFHRVGVNTGVYWWGDQTTGTNINENEWQERFTFWVRAEPVDRESCLDYLLLDGATTDDVYTIDPDGIGGEAAFDVFCDMTTDGGGWAKVLQYVGGSYVPSTDAIGTIADATNVEDAKLTDAQINALRQVNGDGIAEYRQDGVNATSYGYLQNSEPFDDGANAWGFGTAFASMSACIGADLTACTYQSVTLNWIDHLHYGTGGGETWNRLFTGHGPYTGCYSEGTTFDVTRCVSGGSDIGYAAHPEFILWMRPKIYEDCTEATNAGEPAGETFIDADGNGSGAPAIVTCP